MSDVETYQEAVWLTLQNEIQAKRQRAAEVDDEADTEYWNAVANGLSEAAEIIAEAEPNE